MDEVTCQETYQGNHLQKRFSVSQRVSIEPLNTKHASALLEVVNTHRESLEAIYLGRILSRIIERP